MTAQASTNAKTNGTTLATGAKISKSAKLTKAEAEHKALIEKGSTLIADAAWSAGSGEYNLTGRIREALSLVAADSVAVMSGAFAILGDKAKPDPIPAGAGADVRTAMEKEANAKREQWWKAGNRVATICRQARDSMPLDQRPVVSIKLDKSEGSAVVTVIPAGTSREDVAKALDHDKKALAQVVKKLDKEDAERAEIVAKAAGLPSPKAEAEARAKAEAEAKEAADLAKGMITVNGKAFADLPVIVIAAALSTLSSKSLTDLCGMLTRQAERNAKAEAKQAEREAAKAAKVPSAKAKTGKGAAKAPNAKPTPASAGNAQRASKSAAAAVKDVTKPSAADMLDPAKAGVTVTPSDASMSASA